MFAPRRHRGSESEPKSPQTRSRTLLETPRKPQKHLETTFGTPTSLGSRRGAPRGSLKAIRNRLRPAPQGSWRRLGGSRSVSKRRSERRRASGAAAERPERAPEGQKWPILDTVIEVWGSRKSLGLAELKSGQVEKVAICQDIG